MGNRIFTMGKIVYIKDLKLEGIIIGMEKIIKNKSFYIKYEIQTNEGIHFKDKKKLCLL